MTTRRVVQFHQIPQTIINSLNWPQNSPTHLNPQFVAKPPSILATDLIMSYFDKGLLKEARGLFDEMPERDVVAWSSMISGYTSCNHYKRAWTTFYEMMRDGVNVQPNQFTFSSVLKACKGMRSLSCGALTHGLALKHSMHGNLYVDNALMDMYATCCDGMEDAFMVFEEIKVKNAVSWTTLIAGYTHHGDGHGGLRVFKQMILVRILICLVMHNICWQWHIKRQKLHTIDFPHTESPYRFCDTLISKLHHIQDFKLVQLACFLIPV